MKQGTEKREAVQRMFGEIAPTYDRVNSIMTFRLHYQWRKEAVRWLKLEGNETVLDLCCGTGDFFDPLLAALPRGRVVGADFSVPMLGIARQKHPKEAVSVADACRLPFASGSVDAVTVGWGLRNVPDLTEALTEIHRVLRPGGQVVSVDTAEPENVFARWVSRTAFQSAIPMIGSAFGHREAYTYLPKSAERFLSPPELCEHLTGVGFGESQFKTMCMGNVSLIWGRK
ncbi:MAG: Demethylmenaquinone methyltransferase [Fimbriimonadaceae bacterium]|nr:Demethylmenaquinone methyltransferase [Fimbriimonadaceae bacterium]